MLYQIYAMTVKDFKVMMKDRGAMVVLFILPVIFIFVMTASGMGGTSDDDRPMQILVVNEDQGALADEAIAELNGLDGMRLIETEDGQAITPTTADELIVAGSYRVAVIFPADFSAKIVAAATDAEAETAVVTFVVDPALDTRFLAPIQGSVVGYIERTAATAQTPVRIEAAFGEMAEAVPEAQAPFVTQVGEMFVAGMESQETAVVNSGISFEQISPAGYEVVEYPTAEEQNVPAYTLFGVFFIMQAMATGLLKERQDGTFRRLLAAPLPRTAMLIGKVIPYYLINLIQVALMFGIGVFVFDMSLGTHPFGLVLVTMAASGASTGLGLMLASVSKTPEQAGSLAALLSVALAAIGGMFMPRFAMPEFMQTMALFTPHAWALEGFQDVIVRGLGVTAVLNEVAVLLLFSAIFFAVALWRFRFD